MPGGRTPGRGRIVVVEGVDGAGKTTLVHALRRMLDAHGTAVRLVDKNTTATDPALRERLQQTNRLVYCNDGGQRNNWGDAHWLYALGAWFHLLDECVIRPCIAAGSDVLVDNSHYKIWARYRAGGTIDPAAVDAVFSPLSEPDIGILLDVSPVVAVSRRERFTPLESGFTGRFVEYQSAVRDQLLALTSRSGRWHRIGVDDMAAPAVAETAFALCTSGRAGTGRATQAAV